MGGTTSPTASGTAAAASADIWGTADQFRFTHQAASGDFAIVAAAPPTNTNSWAKAGVMIRDGAAADAMHAMVVQTPTTNGVAFQYRTATGASQAERRQRPVGSWVKLTRTGNLFAAAYSTDGTTWNPIGSPVTINMPASVRAGSVTSHNTAALATATFNSVAVTPIVTGSVAGKIFHDTNADNVAAAGDPPLGDVTVYLDANGNSACSTRANGRRRPPRTRVRLRKCHPRLVHRPHVAERLRPAGDPPVVVSSGGSSTADVPHAPDRPRRHGRNDQYLVRRNQAGPIEILIGGALAYSVFGAPPSLTFNLLGGDDTLTLDLPAVSLIPSAASNSMAATARTNCPSP